MAKAKDVEQCASTQKKTFHFLLFVLIIYHCCWENYTEMLSCILKKVRLKPDNKVR